MHIIGSCYASMGHMLNYDTKWRCVRYKMVQEL